MTTPVTQSEPERRSIPAAIAAICVLAFGGVALGPCERAKASQSFSTHSTAETRAMILGPIQDELAIKARQTARWDLDHTAALGASSTFHDFIGDVYGDVRPEASRLAATALSLQAEPQTIEGFVAFQAPGATLMETPTGGRLSVSLFDGRTPDAGLLVLSQSYADIAGSQIDPAGRQAQRMSLRYETAFDAPGGFDGLDVGLAPRAGLSIGEDGPAAEAGATVRLGQYLGEGFGEDRPAWWFFAGADQQALMINPGAGLDVRNAFAFEPYATVGDAQAGVAARLGGANFSIAYIQRETRYAMPTESWKTSEGFAAISLTLKR